MKKLVGMLAMIATVSMFTATAALAEEMFILYDFRDQDGTVSSNTFSGGVTASVMESPSGNTSFGDFSGNQRFEHRLKGSTATTTFTITIPPGVVVDLTQLDFEGGMESNTGSNDIYAQWELGLSAGSASQTTWNDTIACPPHTSFNDFSATLSGLTGLTDTNVTFTFTTVLGTNEGPPPSGGNNNNRYITMDDIKITGTMLGNPDMQVLFDGDEIAVGATNTWDTTLIDTHVSREYVVTNLSTAEAELLLTNSPNPVVFSNGTTNQNGFTISSNIDSGSTNLAPGESTSFTIGFVTNVVGSYTGTVSIANNGLTDPYEFSIEIDVLEDVDPPMIVSYSPTNTQVDVDVDSLLEATFNVPITTLDDGTITITNLTDSTANVITLPDAQVTVVDETLTIDLNDPLEFTHVYAVLISDDAIESSIDGQAFAGISDTNVWSFTAEVETFELTVENGSGDGDYEEGSEVSIEADAAPAGYSFVNWTTEDGGSFGDPEEASTTYTMPGNAATVTTNFEPNEYTVTFDPQDGTATDPAMITVTFDSEYGALPTTTLDGFIFDGWFTADEGGDLVESNTVVAIADDHTLYAQWEEELPAMQVLYDGAEVADGATENWTVPDIDTPVTHTYIVTNLLSATADLELSNTPSVVFKESGDTSHDGFTITQNIPDNTTLEPGESAAFEVEFETSEYGTFSATVSIANNDPEKDPYEFAIEATVEEMPEISPNLIVYEGFNYFPASETEDPGSDQGTGSNIILTGNPDGDPNDIDAIGLRGTWSNADNSSDNMYLVEGSLEFGNLPTSGNHIRYRDNGNQDRFHRELTEEAADAIANADEIWISFLANRLLNNWSNGREGVAIANGVLNDPKFDAVNASGRHGFGVAATDGGTGWRAWGWDGEEGVESTGSFTVPVNGSEVNLLIGHISFDSGENGKDVFTLYHYNRDFAEGTITADMENLVEFASIEVDVDQSLINRLNVTRQVNTAYDEIRIGTTLDSVLGLVEPPSGTLMIIK